MGFNMAIDLNDNEKQRALIDLHEVNLFGQAQKNIELMKEILKATQQQLDKIYKDLSNQKQQEKTNIQIAQNVPAPVAEVSEIAVHALNTIHYKVSQHNEDAKQVEAQFQMLLGQHGLSLQYKDEIQANLDILNAQNEALVNLQKKLAKLVVISPIKAPASISKVQLTKILGIVEQQLKDLQLRNKSFKDKLQSAKQLKSSGGKPSNMIDNTTKPENARKPGKP